MTVNGLLETEAACVRLGRVGNICSKEVRIGVVVEIERPRNLLKERG